jgi:hypothetical protein
MVMQLKQKIFDFLNIVVDSYYFTIEDKLKRENKEVLNIYRKLSRNSHIILFFNNIYDKKTKNSLIDFYFDLKLRRPHSLFSGSIINLNISKPKNVLKLFLLLENGNYSEFFKTLEKIDGIYTDRYSELKKSIIFKQKEKSLLNKFISNDGIITLSVYPIFINSLPEDVKKDIEVIFDEIIPLAQKKRLTFYELVLLLIFLSEYKEDEHKLISENIDLKELGSIILETPKLNIKSVLFFTYSLLQVIRAYFEMLFLSYKLSKIETIQDLDKINNHHFIDLDFIKNDTSVFKLEISKKDYLKKTFNSNLTDHIYTNIRYIYDILNTIQTEFEFWNFLVNNFDYLDVYEFFTLYYYVTFKFFEENYKLNLETVNKENIESENVFYIKQKTRIDPFYRVLYTLIAESFFNYIPYTEVELSKEEKIPVILKLKEFLFGEIEKYTIGDVLEEIYDELSLSVIEAETSSDFLLIEDSKGKTVNYLDTISLITTLLENEKLQKELKEKSLIFNLVFKADINLLLYFVESVYSLLLETDFVIEDGYKNNSTATDYVYDFKTYLRNVNKLKESFILKHLDYKKNYGLEKIFKSPISDEFVIS